MLTFCTAVRHALCTKSRISLTSGRRNSPVDFTIGVLAFMVESRSLSRVSGHMRIRNPVGRVKVISWIFNRVGITRLMWAGLLVFFP